MIFCNIFHDVNQRAKCAKCKMCKNVLTFRHFYGHMVTYYIVVVLYLYCSFCTQ